MASSQKRYINKCFPFNISETVFSISEVPQKVRIFFCLNKNVCVQIYNNNELENSQKLNKNDEDIEDEYNESDEDECIQTVFVLTIYYNILFRKQLIYFLAICI